MGAVLGGGQAEVVLLTIVIYALVKYLVFFQVTVYRPCIGGEIDGAAHGVMNAAHIQHQLPVNEDPAVVVPLEFENHVLHVCPFPGVRHVDLAALGHGKGQVKALAEHVVEIGHIAARAVFGVV